MRVLFSRRWIGIHLGVWLGVAVCAGLCWWQVDRAGQGNARSLGYAFEWPTFAVIIIVLWVRGMRDELRRAAGALPVPVPQPAEAQARLADFPVAATPSRQEIVAADEADDPELAAYNKRLARLHEEDQLRAMERDLQRAPRPQ